jgi:hypothetical protein
MPLRLTLGNALLISVNAGTMIAGETVIASWALPFP